MDIQYIGEQLIWGKIGNGLIVLAFTTALLSAVSYFVSFRSKENELSWKRLSRVAFGIHGISVFGIFAVLFYLIYNHRFEYFYVWEHSSTILPFKYMFACFWEGQEGSFLLWTFWQVVIGIVLIRYAKSWEAPVMTTVMLAQVFLCSMVLGVYILGIKIGSNPFILLRENPQFANLPFIQMPDYLSKLNDGRGLNPLLQNYWMVIHPPTLFLGFTSTIIPFAFAMAGLMTGRMQEWIRPALPYTYFGVMILGTGILMGAAWAYEALSFGGFWAWDPVENASLVPWLTLVGSAHVMIIHKKNGSALLTVFALTIITFILVLYSTFLTRSGILGETSVHAFTDLGMSGQLIIYMAFFFVMAVILLIIQWKKIPKQKEEDSISSREFWMFIGMLVLLLSCMQVTFTTSVPVINKLFNTKLAPPVNVVEHYNKLQIPIATVICILIAIAQFFKFHKTEGNYLFKKIAVPFFISLILSIVLYFVFDFARIQYTLLMFASNFAIIANADYLFRTLKGNISHSGASIAHVGIGMILLGALISNSKSTVISRNMLNVNMGKDFPNNENIMLLKNDTIAMDEYYVSYSGYKKEGVNVFYDVDYFKRNPETGKLEKKFTLTPILQLNERMGNVAEPATKRFLGKDIYTHLTYADVDALKGKENPDEYGEPKKQTIRLGDTLSTSNSLIVFYGLNKDVDKKQFDLSDKDIAVGAQLKVIDLNKQVHNVMPLFIIKDRIAYSKEETMADLGIKISFDKIIPEEQKFEFSVSEKKSNSREFIIMKAIIFPQINILWIGCILMIIGTWIAIRKRFAENRRQEI